MSRKRKIMIAVAAMFMLNVMVTVSSQPESDNTALFGIVNSAFAEKEETIGWPAQPSMIQDNQEEGDSKLEEEGSIIDDILNLFE